MASKLGHAGGIPERRVRPIWDAVDSRQFKTAFKLSAALLAKYPNFPYALALKALILERTGKLDEALSVCLEATELLHSSNLNAVHVDDLTLSTLQIVFQRLNRLDLATSCYEHACGKFPSNFGLLTGLFNCYVREYSFVKQQQTAIKLYKIDAEESYLLWAICSIQLQVLCRSGGEKLLSLAEALLKRHIDSHSLREPEAVVMYISILEQQGKYVDALDILSGNLGSLIGIEADKLRLQGRLLARAYNFTAAAEIYQKVLEARPDDWGSFLNYLGCLLETDFCWSTSGSGQLCPSNNIDFQGYKSTNHSAEVFDSRMASALSFVQKLQLEVDEGLARCPCLASIEIERQYRLRGKVDAKLMEALLNYFHRFGHLSCFASDLESFSSTLTPNERVELLEKFVEISVSLPSAPLKKMRQAITIFKLKELFGFTTMLPAQELEETVVKMVDMYCKNLALSSELDPQENVYGEELLHMASSTLVMLYWRTRNFRYFLEALLVLEFGLNIRQYVWQYKLPLVHLYSFVNALPLAYEWYGTLEAKNILLETSSHHILPQLLLSPLWLETCVLLKDYLKFMDDYLREAADLTFLAYSHRNYSKVIEFVQFKERLEHSNQYLSGRIEYWILQLKQKTDTLEEVECILERLNYGKQVLELASDEKLKSLTFNEDLQTRPWWSPSSHVNYLSEPFDGVSAYTLENLYKRQACENSSSMVRDAIARKSLIPRLIHLSIQSAATSLKEAVAGDAVPGKEANSSEELKFLLERYAAAIGLSFDDAVKLIHEISEGRRQFKEIDKEAVVDWMNFAVFLNAWKLSSGHDDAIMKSWDAVEKMMMKICSSEQLLTGLAEERTSEVLVRLITEPLSWHGLVIQGCVRAVWPWSKKKKKSGMAGEHSSSPRLLLEAISNSAERLREGISEVRRWLEGRIGEDSRLESLMSQLKEEDRRGSALSVLDECASSSQSRAAELGERICGALQQWNSAEAMRKLARSQDSSLLKFREICDSKLRMLDLIKRQCSPPFI